MKILIPTLPIHRHYLILKISFFFSCGLPGLIKGGACLLALFLAPAGFAQKQYLKASLENSITIEPESSIRLGGFSPNSISLDHLLTASDGYVNFTFAGLTDQNEVRIGLQDETGSVYYQLQFANGQITLSDHLGTSFSLLNNTLNHRLFKIRKCGTSITWLSDDDVPILRSALSSGTVLSAKVSLTSALGANLDLVFDTVAADCEKCESATSPTLFPGDILLAGYDNAPTGNTIVLKTLIPLATGTSFQLLEGNYVASNQRWLDATGAGGVAIQKIVYTGSVVLPIGTTICFTLPTAGFGDDLLATDFRVDGAASSDFCVENAGNTVNPQINLSSNNSSALFLVQGGWKLLDAHSEFFGSAISGLQYGGHWQDNAQSPSNGLSNLPVEIECMATEDGLGPASRYAYYTGSTLTVADISNFANWQTGSGAMPAGACGGAASLTAVPIQSSKRTLSDREVVRIYPNPFQQNFTIELQLTKPQIVQLDLYDSSGSSIYSYAYGEKTTGTHLFPLRLPKGMSDLVFWARIRLADQTIVKRVVKQGTGISY